ncbi:MAG: hypothetical protein AAF214_07915, partial [Pseudomonadota bacterium]
MGSMCLCAVMVLGLTDPRVRQALVDWTSVAPGLGFEPGAFRSKLIWQKDEPARSHVVIRLAGPRRLILKRVFAAAEDAGLLGAVAAQQDAFARLAGSDTAHAPEVLYASDDATLVVMAEARGKTLNDHLTSGRTHAPLLRRAGAWLSTFHGAGHLESRTYQPKFMVRHAERMAD